MPTAIDRRGRRRLLKAAFGLAAGAGISIANGAARPTMLAAAWTSAEARPIDRIGLLAAGATRIDVIASVDLPGRAHGLVALPDGSVLAMARRPGEWLLRWHPRTGATQWFWIEPDRAFTGHALLAPDGQTLWTGETDLASGAGLIGVRDATGFDKRAEFPTRGRDPHQFTLDDAGRLVVANGGIATRPESGRRKLALDTMDASIVRLDARDGKLLGQWRLDDERLSIRHLAWSNDAHGSRVLGIALQAEHAEPERRERAPVLALFDGEQLRCAEAPPCGGYGGDIAALASGFAVSCPRARLDTAGRADAGSVVRWDASGRLLGQLAWPQACALVHDDSGLWCGGAAAGVIDADGVREPRALDSIKLDNHWLRLA